MHTSTLFEIYISEIVKATLIVRELVIDKSFEVLKSEGGTLHLYFLSRVNLVKSSLDEHCGSFYLTLKIVQQKVLDQQRSTVHIYSFKPFLIKW